MSLSYRVVKTSMQTSPYALERLGVSGDVVSVRPASPEEYELFRLVLRLVG